MPLIPPTSSPSFLLPPQTWAVSKHGLSPEYLARYHCHSAVCELEMNMPAFFSRQPGVRHTLRQIVLEIGSAKEYNHRTNCSHDNVTPTSRTSSSITKCSQCLIHLTFWGLVPFHSQEATVVELCLRYAHRAKPGFKIVEICGNHFNHAAFEECNERGL